MKRAIELARKGWPACAPNPLVGCVIVHQDKIIGEGYHRKYGQAHAEINAINSVSNKKLLTDSVLYVTLEPCNHHGKTPPCTQTILDCGIPRVIIGSRDPFETRNSKGMDVLHSNNVHIESGVLKSECEQLNKRFTVFHRQKRPYIILKWAQSRDGFIAPLSSDEYWITNHISDQLNHLWRSHEESILTGRKTIDKDDPSLTTRHVYGDSPIRLVIDPQLKLSNNYRVLSGEERTVIFNDKFNSSNGHIHYVKLNFESNVPKQILDFLYLMNVQSVIVEGGSETLTHFIEESLWDEARVFSGAIEFGKGIKSPDLNLVPSIQKKIGTNHLSVTFNS